MIEEKFQKVYNNFRLFFYKNSFERVGGKESSLTTVETFCMETIHALGEPTINEFATFIGISTPNAAYKVNSLVKKGYVEKIQSKTDKREYHLRPTKRYFDYSDIANLFRDDVMERVEKRITKEEKEQLERMLDIIMEEQAKDFARDDN